MAKKESICQGDKNNEFLWRGEFMKIKKGAKIQNGLNLRAVYNDAEVYLLDDPLSAVDSHVGKHIFNHVISHDGLLSDKTRVLVTHGITYLPKTDHIIVLKDGKISEQGSYQELVEKKGDFANFLLEYMQEEDDSEGVEELKKDLETTLGKEQMVRKMSRKESVSENERSPARHLSKSESITGKYRKT